MDEYYVSIIVPIYKVPEHYLVRCITSIQNQSMKNIEIILVDDGSPDMCGDICDEYAQNDNRIKVVHKENSGLSAARNTGEEAAQGKYIMFVDGDDWIEPEMCKEMYAMAEDTNSQLVMCGLSRDYKNKVEKYKVVLEDNKVYQGEECEWLQQQLLVYNSNIAVAYAKLIRRDFLINNNIYHNEILRQGAEGLEFNLRLFDKLDRATFIDKPFYHYIYNENSISSSSTEENNQYVINCFDSIYRFVSKSKNSKLLISWFYNRLLYVIVTTAISGYFNPNNEKTYKERKKEFNKYLKTAIVREALNNPNWQGLSWQRIIVLWMIKYRFYLGIELLGRVRRWQKKQK
jgi:glycosyltransferase involved in cell wall biosynthesis